MAASAQSGVAFAPQPVLQLADAGGNLVAQGGVAVDGLDKVALGVGQLVVEQHLGGALDRAEGRAQLVGHGGEEVRLDVVQQALLGHVLQDDGPPQEQDEGPPGP